MVVHDGGSCAFSRRGRGGSGSGRGVWGGRTWELLWMGCVRKEVCWTRSGLRNRCSIARVTGVIN